MSDPTTTTGKRKPRTAAPATTATSSDATVDTLALVRAIQSIQQHGTQFTDAVKRAEDLIANQFSDLELRIQSKRRALDALDDEFAAKNRAAHVQMDLDIRAYGRAAAVRLLETLQPPETAIAVADWDRQRGRLAELEKTMEQTIRDNADAQSAKAAAELSTWKTQVELQHKAVLAEQSARCTQLSDHIKVLEKQIQQLQNDVEKQRQLTKDVADAARPMAHAGMISGSFSPK